MSTHITEPRARARGVSLQPWNEVVGLMTEGGGRVCRGDACEIYQNAKISRYEVVSGKCWAQKKYIFGKSSIFLTDYKKCR